MSFMAVSEPYTRLLADEELRAHLERKETIVFKDFSHEWQQIERQVEQLGFGDLYLVTQNKGPNSRTIRVAPVRG